MTHRPNRKTHRPTATPWRCPECGLMFNSERQPCGKCLNCVYVEKRLIEAREFLERHEKKVEAIMADVRAETKAMTRRMLDTLGLAEHG